MPSPININLMIGVIQLILFVVVVRCTIDPSKIPKFQTNIDTGFPVHFGRTVFTSEDLIDSPLSLNQIMATAPEIKVRYSVTAKNISQQILPEGFPPSQVYAFGGDTYDFLTGKFIGTVFSWPAPAFVVPVDSKLEITWKNNLIGKHMFAIEKNLNFMQKSLDLDNFIPLAPHIHGLSAPSWADGGPQGWFTYDGRHGSESKAHEKGSAENEAVVEVLAHPEEALMLYHDHSLGMTRLNFYSGLAGFFVVEDLSSPLSKMFNNKHDIFLAIADRSFNEDGSLFYPSTGPVKEFPNWVPEFEGDVMTVNGKAYPNMNVERNLYRVRLLNICNTRGLTISFKVEETGAVLPFLLYKTDSSYHYKPLQIKSVTVPPAGRVQIVVDFTNVMTKRVIMQNVPLPNEMDKDSTDKNQSSTDQIMSFTPSSPATIIINSPNLTTMLNANLIMFPFFSIDPTPVYYTLYELKTADDNSLGVFINGVHMDVDADVFDLTKVYDLYIINLTDDAHPIHTHLINFQHYKRALIDRKKYSNDWKEKNGGEPPYRKAPVIMKPDDYLNGTWTMLDDVHRVWKDVANVDESTVSAFRMRLRYNNGQEFSFDLRHGRFVMHCHILEHQDNDMMRYFTVV